MIRLLLSVNPSATKTADPEGKVPLHYAACWGPSSVIVVDMLLLTDASSRDMRASGGLRALDMAKAGDYPGRADVVSSLSQIPEGTRKRASVIGQFRHTPLKLPSSHRAVVPSKSHPHLQYVPRLSTKHPKP